MPGLRSALIALGLAAGAVMPAPALAQGTVVEGHVGGFRFNDGNASTYRAVGAALRRYVMPRLSLGVGLTHLDGPGRGRIVYLQGLVSADLSAARPGQALVPYLSLSAGFMHDSHVLGSASPWTGAADLMAGTRVRISDRWFVAPEAGFGVTSSVYTRFGLSVVFRP
jgi:hypothetical protein